MSEKKTVPFQGTAAQEEQLRAVISRHKEERGALIPVLHEAQEIYGYLPIEVQEIIAEELGLPLSEVYGVVSFYTQFSINPKGKYAVSVCLGTACYVKGSQDVLDKIKEILKLEVDECTMDGKFSLSATRCIGACGLAPVMTVNDHVYGRLVPGDVEGILKEYMD